MARLKISIVSHGQGALLEPLLIDLARLQTLQSESEIVVTLNIPEAEPSVRLDGAIPLRIIRNSRPKGFGANHNAAFRNGDSDYFCVLNPDIRLPTDPFPALMQALSDARVGVAAPQIVSPAGALEDSARAFPTPAAILGKALGRSTAAHTPGPHPDWVAGMFMLFRSPVFAGLDGFDERYFLYYEDVDLCARLRLEGYEVALCPQASAIHAARRTSHRNARYMARHLASMARFFLSPAFRGVRALDR
jgi:GT2 family glycosyltransferase